MPFPTSPATRQHKPKLLDQVRQTIRRKHYSLRTEQAYVDWIRRYIFFHKKRHPAEMGAQEMEQFLNQIFMNRHCTSMRRSAAQRRTARAK